MAEYSSSSASAEQVAVNSDHLIEILIRLPVRSLRIFKSVSKQWLSIITSHFFALLRHPDSSIVSGLFLDIYSGISFPELNFIPFINTTETPSCENHPQFTNLAFFQGLSAHIRIIDSCHGLLLCCFGQNQDNNPEPNYFILNPTTKQFKILPRCHISNLICLNLAFDPSKSPYYKVVCVYTDFIPTFRADSIHLIMTYSSETGSWKASGLPFAAKYKTHYTAGVYWNGAVNLFNRDNSGESVYYNVDDERLGNIPLPAIPKFNHQYFFGEYRYYGESRGHLDLVNHVEDYGRAQVEVYELERDYSGWVLKFRVDLDSVEIPRHIWSCRVLSLVRMERDEESFLVLHVPGKILRHILGSGNLDKICDVPIPPMFPHGRARRPTGNRLRYSGYRSFRYIESLFGV